MDRVRTVSDEVLVAATPASLYALVSDPSLMRRWSPENTGASTTGSLPVGAQFDGTNRRGRKRWVTRSVVTAADPGSRFAFRVHRIGLGRPLVPSRNASWEYRFTPVDGGTLVTETWTDDRRWPDALVRAFDTVATGTTFAAFQRGNIRRTLDRLKADAEQG